MYFFFQFLFQEEVFDDKQSAMVLKNCSFSRSNLVEMAGGPKNGLKDVTLAIRKGELVGLLGGMASGKSTLVIINNFLQFLNFK